MSEEQLEKWVTMKDVQEYLGVRRETITQWIHKRDMPAYKVGRFWKFKITEIDQWIRAGGAAGDVNEPRQKAEADNGSQI